MTVPGIVLSQPLRATTASKRWPRATSSIESAMTSRLTRHVFMPVVPMVMPSEIAIGVELHRRAAGVADALLDLRGERAEVEVARHRLDPAWATPMIGLAQRLVVEADALEVGAGGGARGALREGAGAVLEVEAVRAHRGGHYRRPRRPRGARAARALRRRRARSACGQALALPLAQAPEVAADLLGIDLAAGQVHVRAGDQAPLVAGQRHPLRQHVVGVGQPRAAVGPRLVGELDAVLVEQLARLRAGRRRSACAGRRGRRTARRARSSPSPGSAPRSPPQTRMKPRSRYIAHSSSLTHERSSWRARCSARRSRPGS